jgi:hypothetical protein
MKNKLKVILVNSFLLATFSCNDQVCDELKSHFEVLDCENNKCIIDLKNIFTEPWEQLFIFHGFNTPEDISNAIGFKYSGEAIYDPTRLILQLANHKILKATKTECLDINLDKVLKNGYYKKDRRNSVVTITISGQTNSKYIFEN